MNAAKNISERNKDRLERPSASWLHFPALYLMLKLKVECAANQRYLAASSLGYFSFYVNGLLSVMANVFPYK